MGRTDFRIAPSVLSADFARLGDEVRVAPAAQSVPSAAMIGQIGHVMLASGKGISGDALEPFYLRPSEAELKARRG